MMRHLLDVSLLYLVIARVRGLVLPEIFNEKQVEMDEQFDGYYGIETSDKSLSPEKVIELNTFDKFREVPDP